MRPRTCASGQGQGQSGRARDRGKGKEKEREGERRRERERERADRVLEASVDEDDDSRLVGVHHLHLERPGLLRANITLCQYRTPRRRCVAPYTTLVPHSA
eukprot:2280100-Rhodomonas_salina.1